MIKQRIHSSILSLFISTPAISGSGLYFGVDAISHELRTQVEVNQTFSLPPPDAINVTNSATKEFTDFAIRIGYKYKQRLNHKFFLGPELMVSQLDENTTYATNFKIGAEINKLSIYGVGGISHINQFEKNQFNYGVGLEYAISNRIAFNIEWQKYETIKEDTLSIDTFGNQILTTTTNTQRDISAIKLGITIYLHE